MHVGIEGSTPGVEWGKELSLSVEEWSSPESHEAWADADGPQPVTYTHQGNTQIHHLPGYLWRA